MGRLIKMTLKNPARVAYIPWAWAYWSLQELSYVVNRASTITKPTSRSLYVAPVKNNLYESSSTQRRRTNSFFPIVPRYDKPILPSWYLTQGSSEYISNQTQRHALQPRVIKISWATPLLPPILCQQLIPLRDLSPVYHSVLTEFLPSLPSQWMTLETPKNI